MSDCEMYSSLLYDWGKKWNYNVIPRYCVESTNTFKVSILWYIHNDGTYKYESSWPPAYITKYFKTCSEQKISKLSTSHTIVLTTATMSKKPKTAVVVAIFETLIWRPRVFLCNWAIVYTTLTNEYWSSTPWCRSKCTVEEVPMLHGSLTMWSTRHSVAPEEVGGWPTLTKISLISASQQDLLAFTERDPTFPNKTQSLVSPN